MCINVGRGAESKTQMQGAENSPVQGAGNGRQQVDAPLAPLGVSATQESKASIP